MIEWSLLEYVRYMKETKLFHQKCFFYVQANIQTPWKAKFTKLNNTINNTETDSRDHIAIQIDVEQNTWSLSPVIVSLIVTIAHPPSIVSRAECEKSKLFTVMKNTMVFVWRFFLLTTCSTYIYLPRVVHIFMGKTLNYISKIDHLLEFFWRIFKCE